MLGAEVISEWNLIRRLCLAMTSIMNCARMMPRDDETDYASPIITVYSQNQRTKTPK